LGEQRPCSGFLLRISKQDIKKPESQSVLDTSRDVCLEEASPVLCADIVARLSESFHFDGKNLPLLLLGSYASKSVSRFFPLLRCLGMADYQHVIPIHADIAQQKKRKWMDVDPLTGTRSTSDIDFLFFSNLFQISCGVLT